jgi:hypothetical protein
VSSKVNYNRGPIIVPCNWLSVVLLCDNLVAYAPENFAGNTVDDDDGADTPEACQHASLVERIDRVDERVVFARVVRVEKILVCGKVVARPPLPQDGTGRHIDFLDDICVDDRPFRLASGNTSLDSQRCGVWLEGGIEQTAVAVVICVMVRQRVTVFSDDLPSVIEFLHDATSIFLRAKV